MCGCVDVRIGGCVDVRIGGCVDCVYGYLGLQFNLIQFVKTTI